MHISNERYFHDRQRHDLALRMIRHEARTCTIRSCTGLTDDRIRRLYKTYASHMPSVPVRRRRGKSPRQVAFFVRNARAQLESSMLASVFGTFGLLRRSRSATRFDRIRPGVLRRLRNASAAAAQRGHLFRARVVSPAAVVAQRRLARGSLPTLRQSVSARSRQPVSSHVPGVHAEANAYGTALIQSRAWRCPAPIPTCWPDRISNAPRTGARTKSVCARRWPIRRHGSCRCGRRALCTGARLFAATLETHSFQARPFYEKRGYEVFATLEDYPGGTQILSRKRLSFTRPSGLQDDRLLVRPRRATPIVNTIAQIWFKSTDEFDAAIRREFLADYEAAAAGALRSWEAGRGRTRAAAAPRSGAAQHLP